MAERFKAPSWKGGELERVPGVRIPPPPISSESVMFIKTVEDALTQALDMVQTDKPYSKCVLIFLNDTGDSYNRAVISNGVPPHEIAGMLEMAKHDVLTETSHAEEDSDDGDGDGDGPDKYPWPKNTDPQN